MISDIVKGERGISIANTNALHGRYLEKSTREAIMRRWLRKEEDGEDAGQEMISVVEGKKDKRPE